MIRLLLFSLASAVPVQFDNDFDVDIDVRTQTALVTMHCRASAWCALILGNSLRRADIILLQKNIRGEVTVTDDYSFGTFMPELDTDLGGESSIEVRETSVTGDEATAVLVRSLTTGDRYDSDFVKDRMNLTYARSPYPGLQFLSQFSRTIEVNLNPALVPISIHVPDWKGHGSWFLWLWACAVPIYVGISRAARWIPLWILVHVGGGMAVISMNTYVILHAFYKARNHENSKLHARDGLTIGALSLLQLGLGFATIYYSRTKKYISRIRIARKIHTFLGIALFVMAMRNIYGGRRMAYDSSELSIWLIVLFSCVFIVEEAFSHSRHITDLFLLIWSKQFTHAEVFDLIHRGKSLCFLDQYVISVFSLELYHPGGVKPITKSLGEDLGKYLNGVMGFNRLMGYHHSLYARQLSKRLAIGRVKYPEGIVEGITGNPSYDTSTWRLSRKIEVAQGTFQLALSSKSFRMCARPSGVDWMGKHLMIKHRFGLEMVRRYYSLSLCTSPARVKEWLDYAREKDIEVEQPDPRLYEDAEDLKGAVMLHVRVYNYGMMSNWLTTLTLTEPVKVKLPLGPGLLLEAGLKGRGLVIAGGSGIVPFLDLVDFLWWKELQSRNYPVDFDTSPLSDFSVTLIAFFHNPSRVLGLHLLQSTHSLCATSPVPRFTFQLRYDAEFDTASKQQYIRKHLQDPSLCRIWVCGPSGLDRTVELLAKEEGVDTDIVTVL